MILCSRICPQETCRPRHRAPAPCLDRPAGQTAHRCCGRRCGLVLPGCRSWTLLARGRAGPRPLRQNAGEVWRLTGPHSLSSEPAPVSVTQNLVRSARSPAVYSARRDVGGTQLGRLAAHRRSAAVRHQAPEAHLLACVRPEQRCTAHRGGPADLPGGVHRPGGTSGNNSVVLPLEIFSNAFMQDGDENTASLHPSHAVPERTRSGRAGRTRQQQSSPLR